ncbi:hypothetical protein ABIE59_003878 [Marinobacter sp. MBR-99]|jgi:hypothetical protein|uniref:hypothetical protein n=1 Tax=Marinobacter sp. MBR-99 TaxID=3156461 RepID=UPI00339B3BA9
MDYSTSNVSTEEIGRIATHEDVKSRTLSVVKKKLGRFLGKTEDSEVHQVAEDALNEVTLRLLNAIDGGTTSLRVEEEAADEIGDQTGALAHPVARYLLIGVANYCNTRLKRWSLNNDQGETGARARYIIDAELADDSDYWDQHLSHTESLASLDEERVDSLLSANGLSGEDIVLIKRKLEGWSFVDLAAQHGGTADKYRRRIQRALDKAGIDSDLLG